MQVNDRVLKLEVPGPGGNHAVLGQEVVGAFTHLEPFLGSQGWVSGVGRGCPLWEAPV